MRYIRSKHFQSGIKSEGGFRNKSNESMLIAESGPNGAGRKNKGGEGQKETERTVSLLSPFPNTLHCFFLLPFCLLYSPSERVEHAIKTQSFFVKKKLSVS